jgi:hypothetical protein
VSINGKPAYVWYLSPTQLNVQAPEDSAIGNVAITVTNCKATSSPLLFARQALAPGLLAPSNYSAGGTHYLIATFASDCAYVLNTSTGAAFGLNSRPAKPGALIIAYGIGFGGVTPSTLTRRHHPAEQCSGQSGYVFLRIHQCIAYVLRSRRRIRRIVRILHHHPGWSCERRLPDQRDAERDYYSANHVPDGAQLTRCRAHGGLEIQS